jgi:hypothetical protein
MIQANELRIGNYLLWSGRTSKSSLKNGQGRKLLTKITYSDIVRIIGNTVGYMNYSPILLTPEILEKCGFKIQSKYSFWNFKNQVGFVLSMWMEETPLVGFEEKGACYWGDSYLKIRFLHQLQNLYFALTGEELVIDKIVIPRAFKKYKTIKYFDTSE